MKCIKHEWDITSLHIYNVDNEGAGVSMKCKKCGFIITGIIE